MISVLTAVLLATPAALPPQEPPARPAFAIVPLQHVCSAPSALTPPPWGSLLRRNSGLASEVDLVGAGGEPLVFSLDEAAEFVGHRFAAASESGALQYQAAHGALQLSGEPDTVAEAARFARDLAATLARPMRIETALWAIGEEPAPAAVLAPGELARFTSGRQPLWRSVAEGRHGQPVAHDRQRWIRYVRSINSEVAQGQRISNPTTDAFCDGGRVVVVPHRLVSGDDLVLHVQFGLGAPRGEPQSMPSGVPNAAALDLPVLATLFGACSARVQNGGALAITLSGHAATGDAVVLTVRATREQPPNDDLPADLGVFAVQALTSDALTGRVHPASPYPLTGDQSQDGVEVDDENESFAHFRPDELVEFLRTQLGAAAEADSFSMRHAAGFLFVVGERTAITAVGQLLRDLEGQLLRNVELTHVARFDDQQGGSLHTVRAPSLQGRVLTLSRLLETNVVRDLDAQIAQEAAVLGPRVETVQSGCWLRLAAAPAGERLHLRLLAQNTFARVGAARSVEPGGLLMLGDAASGRIVHEGFAANGVPIEHGDGPQVAVDGRLRRTSTSTSVKW